MKHSALFLVGGCFCWVLSTSAAMAAAPNHKSHAEHAHEHGADCGHKSEPHDDHVDYEDSGHHHKKHGEHWDECAGPEGAKKK